MGVGGRWEEEEEMEVICLVILWVSSRWVEVADVDGSLRSLHGCRQGGWGWVAESKDGLGGRDYPRGIVKVGGMGFRQDGWFRV